MINPAIQRGTLAGGDRKSWAEEKKREKTVVALNLSG